MKGSEALLVMNKPGGFKCPSCAYPDQACGRKFDFCENGAKALAHEATKFRVTREFFAQHSVAELMQQSDYWLEMQGRLTEPMRYDAASDHYVPCGWDEAFALIGERLRAGQPAPGGVHPSGRTANETAFLYSIFVREFGTNNFPDCSNMCHEPTSRGLPPAIGWARARSSLEDFDHAEAIFVIGQNTGTNSPRMMTNLVEARKRGIPIVAVNPMPERALIRFAEPQDIVQMATFGSTPISSEFVHIRIGGDLAFLKGIMKAVFEREAAGETVLDHDFIREHTVGVDAIREDAMSQDWAGICKVSGLEEADPPLRRHLHALERDHHLLRHGHHPAPAGLAAGAADREPAAAQGQFLGKPGAGISPIRGHSNVQGDRTVGIDEKPRRPTSTACARCSASSRRASPATTPSKAWRRCWPAPRRCSSAGRQFRARGARHRSRLRGDGEARPHRRHRDQAQPRPPGARQGRADPAGGRALGADQDREGRAVRDHRGFDVERHRLAGRAGTGQPGLLTETEIVCRMAMATLPHSKLDWARYIDDYDAIRDAIAEVYPDIYAGFNRKVRQPEGFHLDVAPRRRCGTPNGKANFIAMPGLHANAEIDDPAMLRLATVRSHDQFNTTIYSDNDRYRGVYNDRMVLFMNAQDIADRGLKEYDKVALETISDDGIARRVDGSPCSITRCRAVRSPATTPNSTR